MRHSVLQGIWWNGSLDRYFQELISWSQSLHLSIPKKTPLNPFMVTSASRYWQKPSCKVSAWLHWTPASPKSYILTFPHYLFRTISQSYLQCCLLGCSPRLASNKSLAKLIQYFRFKNKIKLKKYIVLPIILQIFFIKLKNLPSYFYFHVFKYLFVFIYFGCAES